MRLHAAGHLALASSVALALALALAACGRGGEAPGPQVPAPGAPPSAPPSASALAPVGTAPAASGSAAAGNIPPPVGPMKSLGPSAFAEDLKKLGIDPLKPPALNKLSPDVVRKLMPTFSKSLGVKCDYCHDTNNFKAWTPKKHVAAKMWSELVVATQMDDGTPLYCDSCHGGEAGKAGEGGKPGHAVFLDRHDKKALSGWMDANYVKKLKRADKKEQSCETCHGDPFEGKFLDAWAK